MSHRVLIVALVAVVVIVAVVGALYQWLLLGLSSARQEPGPVETDVATWLLHQSVPAEAKARTNPLTKDPAEIAAGHDLFSQKCEPCHGYDGGGKTEIGSGQYPRPPALKSMDVSSMSDGEIFYHIRNGIRNTGMPAWQLPDRQIWQLVAYIRHLPHVTPVAAGPTGTAASIPPSAHYAGSSACQKCHEDIFARWKASNRRRYELFTRARARGVRGLHISGDEGGDLMTKRKVIGLSLYASKKSSISRRRFDGKEQAR